MPAAATPRRARRELSDRAGGDLAQPAPRSGPLPGGARERARRRLVATVLLVYLLAIVEGSLRKYVAPELSQYIFFVRDPFVVYAYVLATRHALWPRHSVLFNVSLAMSVAGLLLFAAQSATGGFSEIRAQLGIYGWRNYFFYVPLAFLVGAQFNADDLARFARATLLLSIPIAVLVVVQFGSPMNAPVNVGIAAEEELQFKSFGLDAERIRPSGPFTSTAGQQQFVVTACAFVLAGLLLPAARRRIGWPLLAAATLSVLTCIALGGSRGTTLQCAMTAGFAGVLALVGRGAALKARALALPGGLALAAVLMYPVVFPEGFAAFTTRWTSAAAVETGFQGGVLGRALYGFVDFIRLADIVPPLGFGLGYGGNASTTLGAVVDGVKPGTLAETDFARHMVDLGLPLGLCYIAFRLAVAVWLTRSVLQASRRRPDPLPMMLFSYAVYALLLGQLTGHGTINVYGWLFIGLCIAASRNALAARPSAGPAPLRGRLVAPAAPRAPFLASVAARLRPSP